MTIEKAIECNTALRTAVEEEMEAWERGEV